MHSLELELQVVVSLSMYQWYWGLNSGPLGRIAISLNHWTISPLHQALLCIRPCAQNSAYWFNGEIEARKNLSNPPQDASLVSSGARIQIQWSQKLEATKKARIISLAKPWSPSLAHSWPFRMVTNGFTERPTFSDSGLCLREPSCSERQALVFAAQHLSQVWIACVLWIIHYPHNGKCAFLKKELWFHILQDKVSDELVNYSI